MGQKIYRSSLRAENIGIVYCQAMNQPFRFETRKQKHLQTSRKSVNRETPLSEYDLRSDAMQWDS